jgi:hypothetical protein
MDPGNVGRTLRYVVDLSKLVCSILKNSAVRVDGVGSASARDESPEGRN